MLKRLFAPFLAFFALFMGFISAAHAELPAGITTAITGYQTDTLAAITAVITAGVVIWALWKLGKKMGWF